MKRPRKSGPQTRKAEAAVLSVRIQPRAAKNEIARRSDGTLKIRLTAPPVDGAANEALVKFLAQFLSLSTYQIEIVAGHSSREKRISIQGMSDGDVTKLLLDAGK